MIPHRRVYALVRPSATRALTLALLGCVLLSPSAAHAAAALSISPSFPNATPVTVGNTNLPASIVVTNNNTSTDGSLTLCSVGDAGLCTGTKGITLLPSCGHHDPAFACDIPDAGVFAIHTPAWGAADSACQGKQFTVAVADPSSATGRVSFTPTVGKVILPTKGSSCEIDFTFDVRSLPQTDWMPFAPGLQTLQIAEAVGVSDKNHAGFARGPSDGVTVMAAPSITTNASPGVAIRGQVKDSATLQGAYSPTGNVTFRLYGAGDTTCSNAVFTSPPVAIANAQATSAWFTPTAAGTYRWIASYGGDANNNAAVGLCDDPGETVVIAKASPSIQSTASADVKIGAGPVTDSATLQGAYNPTGQVTFRVFAGGDTHCSNAVFTSPPVAIAPDGTATSTAFTPSTAGTYRWIASYGGDANNAATGLCDDPGDTVLIAKASPSIQSTASAGVRIGGQVTDSAMLQGAYNPTGKVTFELYGPGNGGCSPVAAFSSQVEVGADATATSGAFTPSEPGTYRWIASYGGDANNVGKAGGCNDPGEAVTVTKRSPTLVTHASASVAVGGAIVDSATLADEYNPTGGQATFRLYGPGDATCAAAPVFSSTVAVKPDGTATSAPYAAPRPGTYRWAASYGGDTSNDAIAPACGEPNETVTVTKASPSVVTRASGSAAVGGQISDSATLGGEVGPTNGNVTFRLYGPDDASCSVAVFQSTVSIDGDGTATSQAYAPPLAGTYRWIASYGGDANNTSASGACNDPGESVTVTKASPSMTTNASPAVAVGASITDSAALAGQIDPIGGSVTFRLFGPADATCSGATIFQSTVAINPDGTAMSAPFTATAAGTYRWIASYSGDASNAAASGACNDTNEAVVVATASPTIVTKASGSVEVGSAVTDAATLVGAVKPAAGNVTFRLYGPKDATCTGAAVFESTVPISAGATATSARFEPTAPGTYRWVARFGGDANNSAASAACNDPDESVTVTAAASPLLCGGTKIALVDVFPEGSQMLISGVARPSYAGKRVAIVLESTRKTVVTALIGANGGFAASAKLPAKRLRANARYRAIVDGDRSIGLKLMRRSYLTRAALRGNNASFGGKVTGKFRVGAKVTLLEITQCTKSTTKASTKLKRNGTWQITIPLPRNASNVLFRAKTTVLTGGRPHQTFTLPRPLSLSAAP